MKLEIERNLDLPLPLPAAWGLLEQIETVAACMPGARITERIDGTHYKGLVAVKLGPANVNFKGDVEIVTMDAAKGEIAVVGKGADGTSSAAAVNLRAVVTDGGGGISRLAAKAEISVNGKVASFGSRLINSVADQVLNQFCANLVKEAAALKSADAVEMPPAQAVPAAIQPSRLNVLAIVWAVIRNVFVGIFSRRRTV
jgi:hypothetical protein